MNKMSLKEYTDPKKIDELDFLEIPLNWVS